MDSTKIDRINTLHHKAQSVGLTEEEKKENERKMEEIMRSYGALAPNEHVRNGKVVKE